MVQMFTIFAVLRAAVDEVCSIMVFFGVHLSKKKSRNFTNFGDMLTEHIDMGTEHVVILTEKRVYPCWKR